MGVHHVEAVVRKRQLMNVASGERHVRGGTAPGFGLGDHVPIGVNSDNFALWHILSEVARYGTRPAADVQYPHVRLEVWDDIRHSVCDGSPFEGTNCWLSMAGTV